MAGGPVSQRLRRCAWLTCWPVCGRRCDPLVQYSGTTPDTGYSEVLGMETRGERFLLMYWLQYEACNVAVPPPMRGNIAHNFGGPEAAVGIGL